MRLKITLITAIITAFFAGCDSGGGGGYGRGGKGHGGGMGHGKNGNNSQIDVNSYPKYELSQANKDDLAFMGNEERLAYDVYMALYNYHRDRGTTINQFYNISTRSETKHIATVRELVNKYNITKDDLTILDTQPAASNTTPQNSLPAGKYDISHIQNLYNTLLAKGKNSVQDALEVGCMVEVTDINDLNPKIDNAISSGAKDLEDAFKFLREGSYNHYWAFDRGLKNIGIEAGCCALGDDWCHEEYPKN